MSASIYVFYSSRNDPDLLEQEHRFFQQLEEAGASLEAVDIVDDIEEAKAYDVIATPTVILETETATERFIGVPPVDAVLPHIQD